MNAHITEGDTPTEPAPPPGWVVQRGLGAPFRHYRVFGGCREVREGRAARLVFIDVDGVLNRHWLLGYIDPNLVERLARLVAETGATLVLSTAWRRSSSGREAVFDAFAAAGMPQPISCTPYLPRGHRPTEILLWLQMNTRNAPRTDLRDTPQDDDELGPSGIQAGGTPLCRELGLARRYEFLRRHTRRSSSPPRAAALCAHGAPPRSHRSECGTGARHPAHSAEPEPRV